MSLKQKPLRRLFSVLAVSALAAIGLMAVSASGAQAATWTFGGQTMSQLNVNGEDFAFQSGGPVTLGLPDWAVDIECTAMETEAESEAAELYVDGSGKSVVRLTGCAFPEEYNESCAVENEEVWMNLQFYRGPKGAYEIVEPAESGVFGYLTIVAQEGEECLLLAPGENSVSWPLTGDFAGALGSAGSPLPVTFSHAIDQAAGLYGIYIGNHSVYITGGAGMVLTGTYAGQALGAA